MPKVNDTQNVILGHAARREDGAIHPLPKSLKADAKAIERAFKGLLRHNLVAEVPATGKTVWRETPDGDRLALAVTDAGRAEAGMTEKPPATKAQPKKRRPVSGKAGSENAKAERPATRQQTLIGLLRRPEGATVPEMMETSGWQAHSVRGFISGTLKTKLGLTVETTADDDRGRVYRITDR